MALQSLNSKELKFAEDVVRIRPGQSANLVLEHRNLAGVELLAYPVDLMTLYLREKDFDRSHASQPRRDFTNSKALV